MPEYLNELLADGATALVNESFTGVIAPWWWERRLGGGIEVCQELDPEAMCREISAKTGREASDVRLAIVEVLDLDDAEPVVLTFEIPRPAASPRCWPNVPQNRRDSPQARTVVSRRHSTATPAPRSGIP
jgi:hypothetical protein